MLRWPQLPDHINRDRYEQSGTQHNPQNSNTLQIKRNRHRPLEENQSSQSQGPAQAASVGKREQKQRNKDQRPLWTPAARPQVKEQGCQGREPDEMLLVVPLYRADKLNSVNDRENKKKNPSRD